MIYVLVAEAKHKPTLRTEQDSPATTTPVNTVINTADAESSLLEEQTQSTLKVGSRTREAASASWWGYVGWGTRNGNVPTAEAQLDKQTLTPSLASESSSLTALKTDLQLAVSTNVPESQAGVRQPTKDEVGPAKDIISEQPEIQRIPSPGDKAPSVFSSETAQSQGSTAWYVPWTWYANSSNMPESEVQEPDAKTTMTQSEIVKKQALARDRGPEAGMPTIEVTSSGPVVLPAQEQINPIESTIFSNTSGWASFFSSKSIIVRRITDGDKDIDGNGMEVMDIDDDERKSPMATSTSAFVAASAHDGKPKDHGKQGAKKAKSSELKTAEPEADKSKVDQTRTPTVPLTNPDAVKREPAMATKRKTSPAPSTTSGGKSPGSPRNPNLVLPTWAHTFHTPPRSMLPSSPGSVISKTLNFVSGVLFQRERDIRRKGKGKEKQKEFAYFGQGLPRAFDVLREPLKPDVLGGCDKAVIIGVHGWFPGTSLL